MLVPRLAARAAQLFVLVVVAFSVAPLGVAPPPAPVQAPTFEAWTGGPRVEIPADIDPTGATDASAGLLDLLARTPDGSTIAFGRGARYRLDHAIRLEDRHRLTFEGQGARFEIAGCDIDDSAFVIDHLTSDVTIRDLTIVGDNLDGGTARAFTAGCESSAGVAIYSGRNVEVADVTIEQTRGECVYIDAGGDDYTWSDGVWFHDSTCLRNGRMAVAIAAAHRVLVERVRFGQIGMFVLDIEPYDIKGGATDVTFRDNVVEGYGLSPEHTQWFVAAEGVAGSLVDGVTVARNVVLAGAPRSDNTVADAGLATTIRVSRRKSIVFTDNRTTVPGDGPALYFAHIDGLTVSGNVQPLTSGSVTWFRDCTSVYLDGMGPWS